MQRWSKPLLRCTRPIRRAKPGCSRPASTAIGSSSRQVTSNSATSWLCSTPLRCRARLSRRYKLPALVCGLRRKLDAPNQDCSDALSEPHDDAGRLSAGAELLEPAGIVAPPIDNAGFPDAGILPAHRRTLEDGKIQMAFFD